MQHKIEQALEKVRPYLQADGGDVKIVSVSDDGVLTLKLSGTCGCCAKAQSSLGVKVTEMIKSEVPGIRDVVIL